MNGDKRLYELLEKLEISFDYYEHPPAPTVEIAMQYWKGIEATHCKNLFFRNHKGNRHYLVILDCRYTLDIKDLEKRLKQGKITFASEQRMITYLGLTPGSVTPFGLINDKLNQVYVYLDENLKKIRKNQLSSLHQYSIAGYIIHRFRALHAMDRQCLRISRIVFLI